MSNDLVKTDGQQIIPTENAEEVANLAPEDLGPIVHQLIASIMAALDKNPKYARAIKETYLAPKEAAWNRNMGYVVIEIKEVSYGFDYLSYNNVNSIDQVLRIGIRKPDNPNPAKWNAQLELHSSVDKSTQKITGRISYVRHEGSAFGFDSENVAVNIAGEVLSQLEKDLENTPPSPYGIE